MSGCACWIASRYFGTVTQIDTASADYDQQVLRHQQSLAHEVEYDREQSQADAHQKFTRNARNFRYAIEAALF